MKKYFFPLFGAVLCAVLFSGCSGEKLSLFELLNRGADSAADGRWKAAEKYALRAVKLSPADPDALTLYALCLEKAGDRNGAIDQISKAAALPPPKYFVLYTKGRLLYDRGDYESCIAALDAASRLRPAASDPLILLAQASVKQNNSHSAMIYYSRLLRFPAFLRVPAPWSEVGMNKFLIERKPREALAYFKYAYALGKKRHPSTVLNMAVFADMGLNDRRTAARCYREYLDMTSNDSSQTEKRASVGARLRKLR